MTGPSAEITLATESLLRDAYTEESEAVGRFNLAVFGPSGVGKSTLINAVFGYEVADTGIGEPVTQDSKVYFHDSGQFGLLDTRGLEIGDSIESTLQDLRSLVDDLRGRPVEEQLHVAWYCISGTGRLQPADERFVAELRTMGLPVVFTLTRVPNNQGHPEQISQQLAKVVISSGLDITSGEPVLTNALGDPWIGDAAFGIDHLIQVTREAAPEGIRAAFDAAQQRDQQLKDEAVAEALRIALRSIKRHSHEEDRVLGTWAKLLTTISITYGLDESTSTKALTRAVEELQARDLLRFVTPSRWDEFLDNAVVAQALGFFMVVVPLIGWRRQQGKQKQQVVVRGLTELLANLWQASCRMYAQEKANMDPTDEEGATERLVQVFVDGVAEAAQAFADTKGT